MAGSWYRRRGGNLVGVLFGYFRLGIDNASKRHARYRFAEEFFADVDVNCEMAPLQLGRVPAGDERAIHAQA
jgi:hypothetical protein